MHTKQNNKSLCLSIILISSINICCYAKHDSKNTTNKSSSVGGFRSHIKKFHELENRFMTDFFNASLGEIGKLANHFEYVNVSTTNVTYLQYRRNSDEPTILNTDSNNFKKHRRKIILIIHGWADNGRLPWIKTMADSYLKLHKDCYVVAVDWQKVANQSYFVAATAVQSVGYIAADFLWTQLDRQSWRLKSVHVIGHSLGGQVAGFLGQKIIKLSKRKVDRITGLDIAGPLFEIPVPRPAELRLSKSDAGFVDVYHTNVGLKGQAKAAGQVDVYFNCGGPVQPGCAEDKTSNVSLSQSTSCSHQAVHGFFINTIRDPKTYRLKVCETLLGTLWVSLTSWRTDMFAGEGISRKSKGRYCVSTVSDGEEQRCNLIYYHLV